MTTQELITLCPVFVAQLRANGGTVTLDWLERHLETCKECQQVMEIVRAAKAEDSGSNQERSN